MIDSKDISVVIQGAIDKEWTQKSILSVRKILPEATIILSTWKGSDYSQLELYDIVVESTDPGAIICTYDGIYNNVARQIVSTVNGLKKVKTPYAVKIRSDMTIIGNQFLHAFKHYDDFRNDDNYIFKNRIVINNLYCAEPWMTRFPFHISDWFQFGNTEDLLLLWDIPLPKEPDNSQYFLKNSKPQHDPSPTFMLKYLPEQTVLLGCMYKKNIIPNMEFYCDDSDNNKILTDIIFANNLVILDYPSSGIMFNKYDPYKWDYRLQFSHKRWFDLYNNYCKQNQLTTEKTKDKQKIIKNNHSEIFIIQHKIDRYHHKKNKNLRYFLFPLKIFVKWLLSPFKALTYYLKEKHQMLIKNKIFNK